MELRDAHRILGLPAACTPAAARSAYRARLRHLHPDTGTGDLRALAEVRSAYRTIVTSSAAAQPPRRPRIDVYA